MQEFKPGPVGPPSDRAITKESRYRVSVLNLKHVLVIKSQFAADVVASKTPPCSAAAFEQDLQPNKEMFRQAEGTKRTNDPANSLMKPLIMPWLIQEFLYQTEIVEECSKMLLRIFGLDSMDSDRNDNNCPNSSKKLSSDVW